MLFWHKTYIELKMNSQPWHGMAWHEREIYKIVCAASLFETHLISNGLLVVVSFFFFVGTKIDLFNYEVYYYYY